MSEKATATVVVKELKTATVGTPPKTLHKLIDGEGLEYATFKEAIIAPARELEGKSAVLNFTVKTTIKDGTTYTNRYLDKVDPAAEETPEPKLGDGSYVKGRENPSTQRSIAAAVALQQAVATINHTIGKDLTAKDINEKVEPLAHAYFLFLLRAGRLMDEEDVPF